jgi:hypothetical protein
VFLRAHRKVEKKLELSAASCGSISRKEVLMARQSGRGSVRPTSLARDLQSAPSRTHVGNMLRSNRFAHVLCLLCLAVTAGWLTLPSAWGQGGIEDIHIKPRIEPPPVAKPIDLIDPSLKTHTKPFKSEVEMVLVPVTVTDPMNRLVTGLDKENFNLFEGKEVEEIKTFSSEDAPVSLGVIFDMSGSMRRVLHDHLCRQA